MTDASHPTMLGYFIETFLMTPAERDRGRKHLLDVAASEGYRMTAIFVETLDRQPAAIEALIDAARRDGVTAVAIAGPQSLAEQHRRELANAGVRLLIAGDPP